MDTQNGMEKECTLIPVWPEDVFRKKQIFLLIYGLIAAMIFALMPLSESAFPGACGEWRNLYFMMSNVSFGATLTAFFRYYSRLSK